MSKTAQENGATTLYRLDRQSQEISRVSSDVAARLGFDGGVAPLGVFFANLSTRGVEAYYGTALGMAVCREQMHAKPYDKVWLSLSGALMSVEVPAGTRKWVAILPTGRRVPAQTQADAVAATEYFLVRKEERACRILEEVAETRKSNRTEQEQQNDHQTV